MEMERGPRLIAVNMIHPTNCALFNEDDYDDDQWNSQDQKLYLN